MLSRCVNSLPGDTTNKIDDFIHNLMEVTNGDDLVKSMTDFQSLIDYSHSIFGLIDSRETNFHETIKLVNVNYPSEWIERYNSQEYYKTDPIIAEHFNNFNTSQRWSETYDKYSQTSAHFIHDAQEFGMSDGITHSVNLRNSSISTFFSFSGDKFTDASPCKHIFPIVIPHLHQVLLRISPQEPTNLSPQLSASLLTILTPRETEVMRWVREGKTNWEISMILGIGERTVKFHVSNAIRKLDAVSRAHAVAKAIELKIISL